jgi:acetylornithine deacetylase
MALSDDLVAAIVRAVDGLREELVRLTCQLVRIPTVNPYAGDASAGRELQGQRFMMQRMQAAGAACRIIDVPSDVFSRCGVVGPEPRDYQDRPDVVGEFRFGRGGPRSVLLNCHMDTVGTEGFEGDPYSGDVREGCIWGRGSTDAKGNLAVGLLAVRALQEAGVDLHGRIVLESVVDEECNGSGGGTLGCRLAGVVADAAIVLDGAGCHTVTGCNGVLTAWVQVRGRGGHAALPGQAVNAIDKAIDVKRAIDGFAEARRRLDPPLHVNLGVFRGGSLPAVVPVLARLEYNISYAYAEAVAAQNAGHGWGGRAVAEQFTRAVAQAAQTDAWLAACPPQVGWIKDLYPFQTSQDQPIVQCAMRAYERVFGSPRPARPMDAWFDAAHVAVYGKIPVVGMGAGLDGAAHTQQERIRIDDMVANTKAVALAVYDFLTG